MTIGADIVLCILYYVSKSVETFEHSHYKEMLNIWEDMVTLTGLHRMYTCVETLQNIL